MKVVIIGYGHAGQAYLSACRASDAIDEIFIVDLDSAMQSHIPDGIGFATQYPAGRFDLAIVATPPSTHLGVVRSALDTAERIILEKPFALSAADIEAIFDLAKDAPIFFSIHARYGEEVALARKAVHALPLLSETRISQLYCDPYWPNGPRNMGGPFSDSIFNALGVVNAVWDEVTLDEIEVKADRADLFDMVARGSSRQGPLRYRLSVDWNRALNLKVTEVADPGRRNGVLINHNQQCVSALSGLAFEQRPFANSRLAAHYEAVVNACLATENLDANNRMARLISEQVMKIDATRQAGDPQGRESNTEKPWEDDDVGQ